MKKFALLLLAMVLATSMSMNAQKKLQWEAVIGMNVAKIDVSGTSSRIGIHVGARLNLQLPSVDQSGFFANAAALLSLKGYEAGGHKVNPTYLEIPIHAGYLYRVSDDVAIFGDAGPYLAFGLMGKSNGVGVFSDTGLGWNNFDMGLGFRAGLEFKRHFTLSVGYDFGLVNVKDNTSMKNRNFMMTLGYKF